MQREFNDTGLCVAQRHYMVDTSSKVARIITFIDKGKYFTINRPRPKALLKRKRKGAHLRIDWDAK